MKFTIYHHPRQPNEAPLGTVEFTPQGNLDRRGVPFELGVALRDYVENAGTFFNPAGNGLTRVDLKNEAHQRAVMSRLPQMHLEAEAVT